MTQLLPPLAVRRHVHDRLGEFFRYHRKRDFDSAVKTFCRLYALPLPTVHWFEYLNYHRDAGRTHVPTTRGTIELVHPENWKCGRKYHRREDWVHVVLHELGHYLCWAWPEKRADEFARRWRDSL